MPSFSLGGHFLWTFGRGGYVPPPGLRSPKKPRSYRVKMSKHGQKGHKFEKYNLQSALFLIPERKTGCGL